MLANPGKGGINAFSLINNANVSFHLGGIAQAVEELIAGKARFHLRIHLSMLMQDVAAHIKLQHRITHPGILAQLFDEFRLGRTGHE